MSVSVYAGNRVGTLEPFQHLTPRTRKNVPTQKNAQRSDLHKYKMKKDSAGAREGSRAPGVLERSNVPTLRHSV